MSVSAAVRRITPPDISAAKGGQPLVCLTAYTTPVARLADAACDVILVGDSLGMVVYGLPSTLGVTTGMMIAHGQAVMRGATRALVVVDLPFGSYEESPAQAFATAARVLAETGAGAVKLEGGAHMADTIRFLTARGIPVMGHVGLTRSAATRCRAAAPTPPASPPTRRRWPRRGPLPWCWRSCPTASPAGSRPRSRCPPSASAPRPIATGRSS